MAVPLRLSGPPPPPYPPSRDLADATDPWSDGDTSAAVQLRRRVNVLQRCFRDFSADREPTAQDERLCSCLCRHPIAQFVATAPPFDVRFPTIGNLRLGFQTDPSGALQRCIVERTVENTEVSCTPDP